MNKYKCNAVNWSNVRQEIIEWRSSLSLVYCKLKDESAGDEFGALLSFKLTQDETVF